MNARHGLALALVIVLPRVAAAQHGEWGFRLGLDDALDAVAAVGVDPDNEPLPIPPRPALHATAFGLGGGQETSSAGSAPELPRLAGPMNRTSRWLTGGLAAASSVWLTTHDRFDSGDRDAVEGPGDLFQYALPAAGFTTAWAVGDTTGRNQQLLAMGVTMAAVGGLKELSEKWRPNFSAQSSFPSGHTAGAFTGAAFVHQRYGARWGAPAYVLAGYTGLSRVFAQKHFLDDVVSGMSIGILSNLLVTRPIDPERASRQRDPDRDRRYRFTWEMGRGLQSKNRIAAPAATGTSFDPELTGEANPTTTGRVAISRRLGDRQT
ncbi:MAG: phosphatase PAP2 family protein, partial [Thermoanaerobaculia bacterium]|nr:phosphatase PAP2 family protein [Thermoanaerobaculia bacterium]